LTFYNLSFSVVTQKKHTQKNNNNNKETKQKQFLNYANILRKLLVHVLPGNKIILA